MTLFLKIKLRNAPKRKKNKLTCKIIFLRIPMNSHLNAKLKLTFLSTQKYSYFKDVKITVVLVCFSQRTFFPLKTFSFFP